MQIKSLGWAAMQPTSKLESIFFVQEVEASCRLDSCKEEGVACLAKVGAKGVEQPVEHHEEEEQQQDAQEVPRDHAVLVDVLQGSGTCHNSLQRDRNRVKGLRNHCLRACCEVESPLCCSAGCAFQQIETWGKGWYGRHRYAAYSRTVRVQHGSKLECTSR